MRFYIILTSKEQLFIYLFFFEENERLFIETFCLVGIILNSWFFVDRNDVEPY